MKRIRIEVAIALSVLLFSTAARAQSPDAIDISSAIVTGGSPSDVANWPITASITSLELGADNCSVEFDRKSGPDMWRNVLVPGWDGGSIQYTLWMVRVVNGRPYTSGGIEFWEGRSGGCGPAAGYIDNWYYNDTTWGPLHSAGELTPGERVGFFVTAGDQRVKDVRSITARSAVVAVPWPGGSGGSFTFQKAPPVTVPPPLVITAPPQLVITNTAPQPTVPQPSYQQPPTVVVPATDLSPVTNMLKVDYEALAKQLEALQIQIAGARNDIAEFRQAVKSKWAAFVDSPYVKYGLAIVAGIVAKWKLVP